MDRVSTRHEGDLGGKLIPIDKVDGVSVTVVVEAEAAGLASTQHTAWMLANLLSRLDRVVDRIGLVCPPAPLAGRIVPLSPQTYNLSTSILTGAMAIGVVPITTGPVGGLTLHVGPGRASGDDTRVYGEGWWGGVSAEHIESSSFSPLPFGPYAAACIAAGEVFRKARMLPGSYEDVASTFFSLWHYRHDQDPVLGGLDHLEGVELDVSLAGVGAVGSTWVHALWACPGLLGSVLLADNDPKGIDGTNLNRYPLFGRGSLGRLKASEAARLAADCRITWTPYDGPLQDVPNIASRVISAVDHNRARSAIQDRYPARILSASTLGLRAEVLRCGPPGEGPCLRCYNPPEALPSDTDIRERLRASDPEKIARLAEEAGVSEADATDWIETGRCGLSGERLLHLLRRRDDDPTEFAVGFVSVLAGAMLASETVKDVLGLQVPLNNAFPRAVYQFQNPNASTNRTGPFARDPSCPKCDPSTEAAKIWQRRFDSLPPRQ